MPSACFGQGSAAPQGAGGEQHQPPATSSLVLAVPVHRPFPAAAFSTGNSWRAADLWSPDTSVLGLYPSY